MSGIRAFVEDRCEDKIPSLREGSRMVSRGSVELLPALKGRQKKTVGWSKIAWLDLRKLQDCSSRGGGRTGSGEGGRRRLNYHAGGPPGYQWSVRCSTITSSESGKLLYPTEGRSYLIAPHRCGAK